MIIFKRAVHTKDIQQARALVHERYAKQGYVQGKGDANAGIGGFLELAHTFTVLAYVRDVLVGTISLVKDSSSGLPMESIFKAELLPFRNEYKNVAEVCQFAVMGDAACLVDEGVKELDVSAGLLAHVIQHALATQEELLCFTINPKHRTFYESFGCVRIGEEKLYPSVNNAPALAYVLSPSDIAKKKTHFLAEHLLRIPVSNEFLV